MAHESYTRDEGVQASSNRSFGLVFAAVFALIGFLPLIFGFIGLIFAGIGIPLLVVARRTGGARCVNCGRALSPDDRFCGGCAAPRPA